MSQYGEYFTDLCNSNTLWIDEMASAKFVGL